MNAPLKALSPAAREQLDTVLQQPRLAAGVGQGGVLRKMLVTQVLLVLLVASAVAVVWSVQETRESYARLEVLQSEAQRLDAEWVRLLLEESTLGSPHLVEQAAANQLGLEIPDPEQVEVLD